MTKELLVFIPGAGDTEREITRERLITGLVELGPVGTQRVEEVAVGGQTGVRITAPAPDGGEKVVDIFEAHWQDQIVHLSQWKPWYRAYEGLRLSPYLFSPAIWRSMGHSSFFAMSILLAILLTVLWLANTLVVAIFALAELTSIEALMDVKTWLELHLIGLNSWVLITTILAVFPVNEMMDLFSFSDRYLRNRVDESGLGLQTKINNRMIRQVKALLEADEGYDQLTILGHSFGAVIAVEVVSKLGPVAIPIRLVTMGSPLLILSRLSPATARQVKALNEKGTSPLSRFDDFYSGEDFLCTRVIPEGREDRIREHRIRVSVPLIDKVSGRSHYVYFAHPEVAKGILTPTGT